MYIVYEYNWLYNDRCVIVYNMFLHLQLIIHTWFFDIFSTAFYIGGE